VEALGLSQETAEALGIGYAPKGMMKGYVAIPMRLPTGELTGYIAITEAKLPKEFHLSQCGHISQEDCLGSSPPQMRGFLFICEPRTSESWELLIGGAHRSEQNCSGQ
jgi:hypothetical protein